MQKSYDKAPPRAHGVCSWASAGVSFRFTNNSVVDIASLAILR